MLSTHTLDLGEGDLEEYLSRPPSLSAESVRSLSSVRSPRHTETSTSSPIGSPPRHDCEEPGDASNDGVALDNDNENDHDEQEQSQFDVIASEFQDPSFASDPQQHSDGASRPSLYYGNFSDHRSNPETRHRDHKRVLSGHKTDQHFWRRMMNREASTGTVASVTSGGGGGGGGGGGSSKKSIATIKNDPYFDFKERRIAFLTLDGREIELPSLVECKKLLVNKEKEGHLERSKGIFYHLQNLALDVLAGFFIYFVNTVGVETVLVVANAVGATTFFCLNHERFSARLDFSFLSFAIVFPLTFLIQAVFTRRDAALSRLADFKASLLATTLFTMTVDWTKQDGCLTGGRLSLPKTFNSNVAQDAKALVIHSYEYLSMPNVSHARNLVFRSKQKSTRRVHASQNDIIKRINDTLFDFSMHTEEMRRCGFPASEASRLHQFHYFLGQQFQQLRCFKYYRTPQATRSFGLAYILILPWMSGPYFAYVYENTNMPMTLSMAAFTFLVLLGLLNTQKGLEDPFYVGNSSWIPGMLDTIKLDFEMAATLQTIEQYCANAELRQQYMDSNGNGHGLSV